MGYRLKDKNLSYQVNVDLISKLHFLGSKNVAEKNLTSYLWSESVDAKMQNSGCERALLHTVGSHLDFKIISPPFYTKFSVLYSKFAKKK